MKERLTEIRGLDTKGRFKLAKTIIDNGYNIKPEEDKDGTSLICQRGQETHRIYIKNNQQHLKTNFISLKHAPFV